MKKEEKDMTINERNIVNRWTFMAGKDLGTDRNVEAFGFANLFKEVFENENPQPKGTRFINPIIRDFVANNPDLEISVVECFDLNHVDIDKYAAQQLDWHLMNRLGWLERYRFALAL